MWRSVASNALTLFIVVLILAFGLIAWGRQAFTGPGPLTQAICFKVDKGASLAQVSRGLEAEGAVSDARIFRIGADYSQAAKDLKFGSYLLQPQSSMGEVLTALTAGGQSTCGREVNFRISVATAEVILRELDPATNRYVEVAKFDPAKDAAPTAYLDAAQAPDIRWRITLAEGVTSWQVVDALKRADFLEGAIDKLPAEGTLSPDSYEVEKGFDRATLVADMEARQAKTLAELWATRAEGLPYKTPEEALVMASIVEKETGIPEERKQVASRVHQPSGQGHEAANRPDGDLWRHQRRGRVGPWPAPIRAETRDPVEHLCHRRPAADPDRQSGPPEHRGRPEPRHHAVPLLRRRRLRRPRLCRDTGAAQ